MEIEHVVEARIERGGRVSRRGFLKTVAGSAAAAGALSFTDLMALRAVDLRRRGMACIVLWMQGGPSQLETFDPKPGHENGGPTQAIPTAVPGIRIAEHWPRVAEAMGHVAIVRSMTNREGNHQRATFQLHTGYAPSGSVRYPALGAIVSKELGDEASELPHFVAVGGRGTEGLSAGILGVRHDPFLVPRAGRRPENTTLGLASDRLERRVGLLDRLDARFARAGGGGDAESHRSLYATARRLALSERLRAFDLEEEPDAVRDAYGRSDFGQGCLLARRLVEAGVTFVEVRSGGWDTHQDNFERVKNLAGQVDSGFARLVRDLRERGMLERTLVIWMGEFGRTPRINPRSGRDHFPRAFNVALAGAGVRGGQVIGASSDDGMEVKDRPVTVPDLFCSVAHALGIDPRAENYSPLGRPIRIVDGGSVVNELFS